MLSHQRIANVFRGFAGPLTTLYGIILLIIWGNLYVRTLYILILRFYTQLVSCYISTQIGIIGSISTSCLHTRFIISSISNFVKYFFYKKCIMQQLSEKHNIQKDPIQIKNKSTVYTVPLSLAPPVGLEPTTPCNNPPASATLRTGAQVCPLRRLRGTNVAVSRPSGC